MTNLESGAVTPILKTDALGRVRTPAPRRERLLDEFEHSGMSGVKFAEFIGIKYQTLATWVQQRRRRGTATTTARGTADAAKQMRWMEAVIGQAQSPTDPARTPLVLHLPGSVRLELTEAKQVVLAAALVRALAQPPLAC